MEKQDPVPEKTRAGVFTNVREAVKWLACASGLHDDGKGQLTGVRIEKGGLVGYYRCLRCGKSYEQ